MWIIYGRSNLWFYHLDQKRLTVLIPTKKICNVKVYYLNHIIFKHTILNYFINPW